MSYENGDICKSHFEQIQSSHSEHFVRQVNFFMITNTNNGKSGKHKTEIDPKLTPITQRFSSCEM